MPGKPPIPKGWRSARLGDVAHIRNTQVVPGEDGQTPYVALEHIISGGTLTGYGKSDDSVSAKTRFREGDTLYGKLRPNLRKVVRADFDGVCSTEILAIFPKAQGDGRFLSHLIRSDLLHGHAMQGITGTKMPRTSWSHLKTFDFVSPPLPEQRAIAAVLDSIDDAIEGVEAVIAATGQLRGSLLHQLLTRGIPGWHTQWKEAPGLGTIPAEWEVVRLGEVAEVIMGQSPPGDYCNRVEEGIPLLNGPTEFGPHHPTPAQWTIDMKKKAIIGDLLFCVRGATVGRMNWADGDYAIGRGIASFRHRTGPLYQRFLRAIIDFKLPELLAFVTGSTFPNLSYEQITQLRVPKIPLPEQRAIASLLDGVDVTLEHARNQTKMLKLLKESTADALLTGRVRVEVT